MNESYILSMSIWVECSSWSSRMFVMARFLQSSKVEQIIYGIDKYNFSFESLILKILWKEKGFCLN